MCFGSSVHRLWGPTAKSDQILDLLLPSCRNLDEVCNLPESQEQHQSHMDS